MEIWKKMWVGVFFWTQCISRDIINRSEFWLDSICGNPRACFYVSHYVSRRLLYNAVYAESDAEDGYWQAATSAQCCRPCGQWHTEVWSWPDVTPPRWASLAGCAREGYLQDGCHDVPLSSWSGTSVPRQPFHHVLRRRSDVGLRSTNRHQLILRWKNGSRSYRFEL